MKTFSKTSGNERVRHIPCPVCGGSSFMPRWTSPSLFVRCRSCGLVYQNPQPVQDELSHRYDDEYFEYEQDNADNFFNLMKLGLRDIGFESLIDGNEHSFLDVGCATGMLPEYMKNMGYREQGVEVCGPAAAYGREKRGVNIFTGTLEEAAFSDSSFSIVHCSHLIEHLTDPGGFVAEVYRILSPGGLFLITTPDISGFQARFFGHRWRSAIDDHMVLFSAKTLKLLLKRGGFHILRRRSWGGIGSGMAPAPVKIIADRLCKALNIGDVMIIAAVKPGS